MNSDIVEIIGRHKPASCGCCQACLSTPVRGKFPCDAMLIAGRLSATERDLAAARPVLDAATSWLSIGMDERKVVAFVEAEDVLATAVSTYLLGTSSAQDAPRRTVAGPQAPQGTEDAAEGVSTKHLHQGTHTGRNPRRTGG